MATILTLLLIFASIISVVTFVKIHLDNDAKIIGVLQELRSAAQSSDTIFPLITQAPPGLGNSADGLTTFEIRTVISFDGNWRIDIVTPAGVQSSHTLAPQELAITLPKKESDYTVGIHLSSPPGFISSRFITNSEEVVLHPPKKSVEETKKLIEAFRTNGAVIV